MTKKEIAEAFSTGKFDLTYPYLSENIIWEVVGENKFEGKISVVKNCDQTAAYFRSVETHFETTNVIAESNKVVVSGTAEFIRDGKRLSFISACEVYEFGDNKLTRISSYCISEKS